MHPDAYELAWSIWNLLYSINRCIPYYYGGFCNRNTDRPSGPSDRPAGDWNEGI